MSNFSVSSLFPFRRVKIGGFSQIVDPDNGMSIFTTISTDFRFNPICHECGNIKVEKLGITDPGDPHVTNRMARYIYELCKLMPVEQVADHLNLDWKTVKNIDKNSLEEFGETDYSHSGYLAVDEIFIGKYHKYLTIIINLITNRVI
jgi:hypothetical protein